MLQTEQFGLSAESEVKPGFPDSDVEGEQANELCVSAIIRVVL
jgi:hypothetical protein